MAAASGRLEVIRYGHLRHPSRVGDLLAQPSFSAGAIFAVVYFAGFTSVFFAISIMWQEGLARSAPITGPDAVASAFSHSAQLALLTNVAIVVLALILVLALPRQIPSRKP